MKRNFIKVKIGDNRYRYRVIVEDSVLSLDTESSDHRRSLFLKQLADTQTILYCGYLPYQTLKVYHNGSTWVAEAEAEGEGH